MAKSFKRFQREPSSREPSIWDVYAGQYPQLSAWGAPTYQHWYPYPFTDPNAPQGSTPVSPSEKLGDPGAAAGGAPGGGAGAGGVGAGGGAGGGVGGAGGLGSPFSGVMPPAVEGAAPVEPFGGEGVASTPAPGIGGIVGAEPSHVGLGAGLLTSAIPTPAGPLGLAAELGKMVAGRGISGIVSGMTDRTTEEITGYDEEGNPITVPVAPTDRTLGFPANYQPVPVTVPQSQILEGTPKTKPVHVAPGAPPENERGLMDVTRGSAPSPGGPPAVTAPQSDIFSDAPYGGVMGSPAPQASAPAPTGPPDVTEAGGIGTMGMDSGGGGGGGGGK